MLKIHLYEVVFEEKIFQTFNLTNYKFRSIELQSIFNTPANAFRDDSISLEIEFCTVSKIKFEELNTGLFLENPVWICTENSMNP